MMDIGFERKLRSMEIDALIDIALNSGDLRLFAAKLDALTVIKERCNKYRENGYKSDLVLTVLGKKLDLLKKASTVKDCEAIQQPSAPKYHQYSGVFETDDTWVAEEELIQWSLASFYATLPPDACKRYFDLFQQVFGVNAQEVIQM